jgi:hypothetical protein
MKETTAEDGGFSQYAKALVVAASKEGKTVGIVANLLGVLPWQKFGGVVDRPEHLHVIALDAGAATGIPSFLKMCGAPEEAFKLRIYNMKEDIDAVLKHDGDYNFDFFNSLVQVIKKIQDRVAKGGTHAVLASSLTTMFQILQRAISGAPGKGLSNMDQNKWGEVGRQVNEVRNLLQQDTYHCLWEGHVFKPPETGQGGEVKKETIQVQGSAGYNFPNNVEQVFRFRRLFGDSWEKTRIDRIVFDTRASLDFLSGGRNFTENLDAKEADLTAAFAKLGLKVGQWGRKKKEKKS